MYQRGNSLEMKMPLKTPRAFDEDGIYLQQNERRGANLVLDKVTNRVRWNDMCAIRKQDFQQNCVTIRKYKLEKEY